MVGAWYCWDGSWQTLRNGDYTIYEEAMWWNVETSDNIQFQTDGDFVVPNIASCSGKIYTDSDGYFFHLSMTFTTGEIILFHL